MTSTTTNGTSIESTSTPTIVSPRLVSTLPLATRKLSPSTPRYRPCGSNTSNCDPAGGSGSDSSASTCPESRTCSPAQRFFTAPSAPASKRASRSASEMSSRALGLSSELRWAVWMILNVSVGEARCSSAIVAVEPTQYVPSGVIAHSSEGMWLPNTSGRTDPRPKKAEASSGGRSVRRTEAMVSTAPDAESTARK